MGLKSCLATSIARPLIMPEMIKPAPQELYELATLSTPESTATEHPASLRSGGLVNGAITGHTLLKKIPQAVQSRGERPGSSHH